MTIQQSVLDAILFLENMVQTRAMKRVLLLCPDELQCQTAYKILTDMDYMAETITQNVFDENKEEYKTSINRLRTGFSKVLITTSRIYKSITRREEEPLIFDTML